MTLPPLAPPDGSETTLWPRLLAAAGGPPLTDELVHATKGRVARELSAVLDGDAMRALIDELEREDPDDYWSSGRARADTVGLDERGAVGMLALAAAWESSGATGGALGVALHLAAAATFGLATDSVERLRLDATGDALNRGQQLHDRHAAALRMYLQQQYDQTQAFLSGATVAIYRGITTTATAGGTGAIPLRPLSSFSLAQNVARAFPMIRPIPPDEHHAVIAAAAPAVRILSTPVTGIASLWEQEVVVLGGTGPGDRVKFAVAASAP